LPTKGTLWVVFTEVSSVAEGEADSSAASGAADELPLLQPIRLKPRTEIKTTWTNPWVRLLRLFIYISSL